MNAVQDQFASNLRYLRKRAGYSQEELSYRADLHRTNVGMLERAVRMPRIDTLVKLAGALGVTAAELLDGIDWTPPRPVTGSFGASEPPES